MAQLASAQLSEREVSGSIFSDLTIFSDLIKGSPVPMDLFILCKKVFLTYIKEL